MRFGLRAFGLDRHELIELTAEEYARIVTSKEALVVMIGVEQKFDLLIDNYADFERELLEISLRYALHPHLPWDTVQDDIAALNRRLANLLSAARLYVDQVSHDLSQLFGSQHEACGAVRQTASEEYDKRLGYRVMEAVRNLMQHRSLPIYQIAYPSDRTNGLGLRFRTIPSLHTSRLREADFKAAVLKELEARGDIVPLTPLVRDYVEGLGQVHEAVRRATSTDVRGWDDILVSVQKRGIEQWGGDETRAFLAVQIDDDDREIGSVHVFTELTRYRQAFECRNGVLKNLAGRYVSGQAAAGDA